MSLDKNASARIREFRHSFAGHRRIVATIRVDLASVRYCPGGHLMTCYRVRVGGVEGADNRRAELYSEFKAWIDYVLSDVTSGQGPTCCTSSSCRTRQSGLRLGSTRAIANHGCSRQWRNPFRKPLSEVLAGMPTENWEDEP